MRSRRDRSALRLDAALPAGADGPQARPRCRGGGRRGTTRVPGGHLAGAGSARGRSAAHRRRDRGDRPPPGHRVGIDDPRRVVAERSDREVGGGRSARWLVARPSRGPRRVCGRPPTVRADVDVALDGVAGGRARAIWVAGPGRRAACSPTGAPTSSRSSRRRATRCAASSACSPGTASPSRRRSTSTTGASASSCVDLGDPARARGRAAPARPTPTCSSPTCGPTRSSGSASGPSALLAGEPAPRLRAASPATGSTGPDARPGRLRRRRVLGPLGHRRRRWRPTGIAAAGRHPVGHRRPRHRRSPRWPASCAALLEREQHRAGPARRDVAAAHGDLLPRLGPRHPAALRQARLDRAPRRAR